MAQIPSYDWMRKAFDEYYDNVHWEALPWNKPSAPPPAPVETASAIRARKQGVTFRVMCGVCGDDAEWVETSLDWASDRYLCVVSCHGERETKGLPMRMTRDYPPGSTVELIAFAEWEK